jgi:molecular chaperone DnaJ
MSQENLFTILGLESGAGEKQIKDAYRRLAKKYHPDLNPDSPGADDMFKRVAHAYWILSDTERKKEYLESHPETRPQTAPKKEEEPTSHSAKADRTSAGVAQEGRDIIVRLHLPLEDLFAGITRKLKIKRLQKCESCSSTGIAGGADGGLCPVCKGSGEVPDFTHGSKAGASLKCRKCGGSGLRPMSACPKCDGRGLVEHDVKLAVGIPPGTSERDKIVVVGQGHEGRLGGKAGDLRVIVKQKDHSYLVRRGDDLVYSCDISITQWLEGCKLNAPTLNGPVSLTLKAGTMPEGTLKVRGKGMPRNEGGRGDFIVRYSLCFPDKLSKKQLVLLKKLESTSGFTPKSDKKGWFRRDVKAEK